MARTFVITSAKGDIAAIAQAPGSSFMFGLHAWMPLEGATWDKLRSFDLAGRLIVIDDIDRAGTLVEE